MIQVNGKLFGQFLERSYCEVRKIQGERFLAPKGGGRRWCYGAKSEMYSLPINPVLIIMVDASVVLALFSIIVVLHEISCSYWSWLMKLFPFVQFLEAFQMTQMFEGFIEMRELPSKAEALDASRSLLPSFTTTLIFRLSIL